MTRKNVYLDNAATTPMDPKVIEKINYGNFSSVSYLCKINIEKLKEYSKEWYYQNA